MKILFICRYNRFRSVLAEGLFNKYNKNSKHKAKSAGLIHSHPIDQFTKHLATVHKIKIKKRSETLSSKILKWQDVIIIVADDVPPSVFKDKRYYKKMKVWKIKDTKNSKGSIALANNVEARIKKFVKEL